MAFSDSLLTGKVDDALTQEGAKAFFEMIRNLEMIADSINELPDDQNLQHLLVEMNKIWIEVSKNKPFEDYLDLRLARKEGSMKLPLSFVQEHVNSTNIVLEKMLTSSHLLDVLERMHRNDEMTGLKDKTVALKSSLDKSLADKKVARQNMAPEIVKQRTRPASKQSPEQELRYRSFLDAPAAKAFIEVLNNLEGLGQDLKRLPMAITDPQLKSLVSSVDQLIQGIKTVRGVNKNLAEPYSMQLTPDLLKKLTQEVDNISNKILQEPKVRSALSKLTQRDLQTFTEHLKKSMDNAMQLSHSLPKEEKSKGVVSAFVNAVIKLCKGLSTTLHITVKPPKTFSESYKQHQADVEGKKGNAIKAKEKESRKIKPAK